MFRRLKVTPAPSNRAARARRGPAPGDLTTSEDVVEQDERSTPAAGPTVARSQHTVYTLPHDWAHLRRAMTPALERAQRAAEKGDAADTEAGGPLVLVVTADADAALAAASAARRVLGADARPFVPLTSADRAARRLRAGTPLGVSGDPATLLELVRRAVLKLDRVRAVVVAWADDLAATGGLADLEALFGELPKEGERTLVTGETTEALDAFVERYLRRPRRVREGDTDEGAERLPTPLRYLTVAASARPAALRRLLDELDPATAVVVAASDEGQAEARNVLATLGYGAEDSVHVAEGVPESGTELVVLYELPADAGSLRRIAAAASQQAVALVQPRQIAALRRITGGAVAAFTLSDARRQAQARDESVRDELRQLLADGAPPRELLTLEPLLAEYDGVEVAAALLRLLDDARRRRPAEPRATAGASAAPAASAATAPWTRVYVNLGTKDGTTAGDVLGALAGEANVGRDKIGRIELRDTHALVEVATDVAERVIEAANGGMFRGRRIIARVDQGRADLPPRLARGERPPRGDRPPRERTSGTMRFERGERGERSDRSDRGERGERGVRGERGERPSRWPRSDRPAARPRADRGDRGDRPPRGGGSDRPRGGAFKTPADERRASFGRTLADEQREWTERGERVRRAKRTKDDDQA